MSKAVFQLEPLTCPTCIKKIETALSNTPGVEAARVLFNSSKVKAEYNEKIEADNIAKIIATLGYEVISSRVSS